MRRLGGNPGGLSSLLFGVVLELPWQKLRERTGQMGRWGLQESARFRENEILSNSATCETWMCLHLVLSKLCLSSWDILKKATIWRILWESTGISRVQENPTCSSIHSSPISVSTDTHNFMGQDLSESWDEAGQGCYPNSPNIISGDHFQWRPGSQNSSTATAHELPVRKNPSELVGCQGIL